MKKNSIFTIVLICAIMLLLGVVYASAAGEMAFEAGIVENELVTGAEIQVPINVTSNPGYVLGAIDLSWDSDSLELTNIVYNDDNAPKYQSAAINDPPGTYRISFGNTNSETDLTGTGLFFTLVFKIKDSATFGEYAINISKADAGIVNNDLGNVNASFVPGKVTLTAVKYAVNITEPEHGTATADQEKYAEGDTVTITATPADGYEVASVTATYGENDSAAVTPRQNNTYTFAMPAADVTVNVSFSPITYTISYELNGGTVEGENPGTYKVTSDAITLINPTKEGYTFAGWTGTDLESATTSVTIPKGSTGNREYTATWTATEYSIAYDLNGGSLENGVSNPERYTIGSDTITLNNPTKEGYTFAGWTGTDLSEATKTVTIASGSTGDRSYIATWTANTYTVMFNKAADDAIGEQMANQTFTYGVAQNLSANTYSRNGYDFKEWLWPSVTGEGGRRFTDKQEVINLISSNNARIELFAQWTPINYNITYDLDGGSVETANPATYTIESDSITLNNPTKKGYEFAGWTGTDLNEATETVTIASGSTGNRSYTATWTALPFNITWVDEDGTELEYDEGILAGTMPTYDGETPTKEADDKNTYEFSGWTPEVEEVTEDKTYTATYKATPINSGGSSGGGNGSSHQPSGGKITIEDTENGTAESNKDSANPGTNVTVTVTPDEGYEVDSITVTDKNGKEIPVTDNGDGTYSFKMPASPVSVAVEFKEADGSGDDGREPDCPSAQFKDVDPKQWYHESVDYAIANGLMKGVSDDQFAPNGSLSRAMLVTVLYRMEGEPAADGMENIFSDVASGSWYEDAVKWATANDIVKGYGNGEFGPNDNITREQMAAIMMRYADYKGIDTSARADISGFVDANEVSDWAYENMQWANAVGLINGRGNNMLVPQGNTTRAEMAAILMRFCENIL